MSIPTLAFTKPFGAAGAPLVVLGPSLGTSTLMWELVVPHLARDFQVTAWDLPGHGSSPAAREAFTVGELADAVARSVGEVGDGTAFYAGDSLGGAVGLELLLRHPQRVQSAAIIASGAKIGTPEGWHERAAQVRATGTPSLIVGSAQRWFAPGSIERQPDISGRLLHALRDADDESYARCCEALADYDVRDQLSAIERPVLAVYGEHDVVTPEASAREIAIGVQNGRVIGITDAAHLPPAEQPHAVTDILIDFFTKGAP